MSNLKSVKLIEVADVKLSNVDKKTKEKEQRVKLCNYTDVYKNSFIDNEKSANFMIASCSENEYKKFLLKKGQVAITKDSEKRDDIGISTYISDDFEDVVLGYHLALLTSDEDKLCGRYLHYWLNTITAKKYFENNASGSGQRCSLNLDIIKSIPLFLPSIESQRKIASVLSSLEKKIALNKRINQELEATAKLIYDYWFVQFDFPNAEGKPYKSSGGKMVYNKTLKREIPEGWEVSTVNELTEIILDHRGKTPKKLGSDWTNSPDGIIALSAKLIKNGKIVNLKKANKVDKELYDKWMSEKLKKGDFLLTSEAPAGQFYFLAGKTNYCLSQRLFALRADQEKILPIYFYNEMSRGHGFSQILGKLSGSTVFGIRQDELRTILCVVPKMTIQKTFNEIVYPFYEKINLLTEETQQLTELRDWLLPMLMNGQVVVG